MDHVTRNVRLMNAKDCAIIRVVKCKQRFMLQYGDWIKMTRFFLFLISVLLLSASVYAQPKVVTADAVGSNAERFTQMRL